MALSTKGPDACDRPSVPTRWLSEICNGRTGQDEASRKRQTTLADY